MSRRQQKGRLPLASDRPFFSNFIDRLSDRLNSILSSQGFQGLAWPA